jgi:hypothetical protein
MQLKEDWGCDVVVFEYEGARRVVNHDVGIQDTDFSHNKSSSNVGIGRRRRLMQRLYQGITSYMERSR